MSNFDPRRPVSGGDSFGPGGYAPDQGKSDV